MIADNYFYRIGELEEKLKAAEEALEQAQAELQKSHGCLRTIQAVLIGKVIQAVAELPDRTSPDDWPEAMLVTAAELTAILEVALSEAEAQLSQEQKP